MKTMHQLLDSLRVALDLPALAGAVVTADGIEGAAAGARRAGGPLNVTAEDRFHLGSNTKAMTATLLATFIDDGRISWTTTLAEAFPELSASMRAEYRTVTLREVLAHVGGIVRDFAPTAIGGGTPAQQRAAAIAWALAQPPAASRGTYSYSNAGFVLAGALAERLAGRDYETLLLERVMQPLGVTTLGFGAMGTPGGTDQPWQHVVGASGQRSAVPPGPMADNPPVYSPSGRVHMSIGDWGRYVQWTLAAGAGAPQTLLRAETAATLFVGVAPAGGTARTALGWIVVDRAWAGGQALTHAGSNGMNYSVAWLAPAQGFGVIVATNQAGGDTDLRLDAVVGRLIERRQTGR